MLTDCRFGSYDRSYIPDTRHTQPSGQLQSCPIFLPLPAVSELSERVWLVTLVRQVGDAQHYVRHLTFPWSAEKLLSNPDAEWRSFQEL